MHDNLLWNMEETQGKVYFQPGIYTRINLAIHNNQGEPVRLKGGFLFLHLKICI